MAAPVGALFLDRNGLSAVRVHPIVVMSILEQYVRRDVDESRADTPVIGKLVHSVAARRAYRAALLGHASQARYLARSLLVV